MKKAMRPKKLGAASIPHLLTNLLIFIDVNKRFGFSEV